MKTHRELIEALGGGTAVASELSRMSGEAVDREAVYKWAVNGIAWKWRPYLKALADRKGVGTPPNFLPEIAA
ncbi:MAG: hypothetical protein GX567_19825 [Clostridia bacterium]|nr:hypothetical protein [Clostridia bacterium]